MAGRPHILAETALGPERRVECEVAILPWGATEPHNLHLPFGTDTVQAEAVAAEAAGRAAARGASVSVLPGIPLGANAQQLDTPLTLNLNPSTQALILRDIVQSLDRHAVGKLLVLNGHGGNDFRQMVRELQPHASLFICCTNWWTVLNGREYSVDPGDHAGELESSVMMHLRPDLVLPLDRAGSGRARRFRMEWLRDGTAWAPRDWARVSNDTGVGDPREADPEKGANFFHDVCEKLADFLVDLSAADVDDLYEDSDSGPT